MLDDIKNRLIIEDYLPTMEFLKNFYKKSHNKFCNDLIKLRQPLKNKLDKLSIQYQNDPDYCVCSEEAFFKLAYLDELIYHHLSSCLQSIVSLWENQMNDFYLLKECVDYNILKDKFLNDCYYDLNKDSNIYEIRQVANYLKHGEFGKAKAHLIDIKSHYINNDGINGEVRGNYLRNKQLNITFNDIEYFANSFINFWNQVLSKLV